MFEWPEFLMLVALCTANGMMTFELGALVDGAPQRVSLARLALLSLLGVLACLAAVHLLTLALN